MHINPSKIKACLETSIVGHTIVYIRQLQSTNEFAKELAMKHGKDGTVIVAEEQTHGKGRLQRRWISPEGGIWLSLLLRPKTEAKYAPMLPLMTSVAVAKTVNKMFPLNTEIKWPNDVLINQKKICGILTEAETKGTDLDFVIVGIGINVNFNVNALPAHVRNLSTTLREELHREIDRETLLCKLLVETEHYYGMFTKRKFNSVLNDWRKLASFLGSYVEVRSDGERIEGWAVNVDEDGALLIKLRDQTIRRVTTGEIQLTRLEYPKWIDE